MAAPRLSKDIKYPDMYRIEYEDGQLSDMYNLSRAKDHLRRYIETSKRKQYNDLHSAGGLPDQEKEEQRPVSRTTSRPNRHI